VKAYPLLAAALLLLGCVAPAGSDSQNNSLLQSVPQNGSPTLGGSVSLLKAQKGDLVAVDYLGTLDDGKAFDTSIKAEAQKAGLPLRPEYAPLEFTVGAGQMIKGFDDGVVGMQENETKTIHISAAEAYGERREDQIVEVPKSRLTGLDPKVGVQLQTSTGAVGTITRVGTDNVTVDFNHPLAGKALNFKITLRRITRP
jgi:peptidylprolyl isomerase